MTKKLLLIFWLAVFISCEEPKSRLESITDEDLTTTQIDSILSEFKFEYESPVIIDSSNYILIPISTELLKRRTKYSKDGYYSDAYPRYWNVLFYDRDNESTNLLSEEKIRISRIYANNEKKNKESSEIFNSKILYEIGDIDFNKDGKLNGKDPEFLFSSENNGSNLKRISPLNEELQYFKLIPNSSQILFRTLRDINQDSIFNKQDESIWYNTELIDEKWITKEIIEPTKRKKIENLYFEQWLKKN